MVAVVLAPQIVSGQFDMPMFQTKIPQAESRQELDKFLDVVQVSEVEALPIVAANFRERFPDSALVPLGAHAARRHKNRYCGTDS